MAILDEFGRPIPRHRRRSLAAQYDVARDSQQNAEHWRYASTVDANTAYDKASRQKSRDRARYEVANNPHLRGMLHTKATDLVGGGPTLNMGSQHQEIEDSWNAWAEEIYLTDKLVDAVEKGWFQDGECISLAFINPAVTHEVPADFMSFEPEQMGNPGSNADTEYMYDGIRHERGIPVAYYIYDDHPNAYAFPVNATYTGEWYEPDRVIHLFRRNRLGQMRGATECGPALPLSAVCRRYTMATLHSAETAANISLWLETDGMPEEEEPYNIAPFDMVPVHQNQVVSAPYRWKIHQLKAEQPVDTYDRFLRTVVTQMGRTLDMPAALSFGDASEYNMASGRLDKQDYIRIIANMRRTKLEPQCVNKLFYFWLRLFLAQRSGISLSSLTIQELRREYPHTWGYQPIHHSDPEVQSNADVISYNAGHTTIYDHLRAQNKDPEQHFKELARQAEELEKIGMAIPGMMPGMPGAEKSQTNQPKAKAPAANTKD